MGSVLFKLAQSARNGAGLSLQCHGKEMSQIQGTRRVNLEWDVVSAHPGALFRAMATTTTVKWHLEPS